MIDGILAAVLFGLGLPGQGDVSGDRPLLAAALGLELTAPLMGRRRYPVAIFATVAGVAFAQWIADVITWPPDAVASTATVPAAP